MSTEKDTVGKMPALPTAKNLNLATMRSQHIQMSWEEFELMPIKLGWKHEYWDGQAHISPRWQSVTATCPVQQRNVHAPCTMRPVTEQDEQQLITGYVEAFRDAFDFCDWDLEKIQTAARDDIRKIFSEQRGRFLAASRIAVETPSVTDKEKIIGAALITESEGQPPLLDVLFVVPHWHRKGIATALVSAASNALYSSQVKTLESRYLLGNEESRSWHQRFGFTEEPDLLLARTYYHHAQRELRRRETIGDLLEKDRTKLLTERDYWRSQVQALEQIALEQGMEAVLPVLRR